MAPGGFQKTILEHLRTLRRCWAGNLVIYGPWGAAGPQNLVTYGLWGASRAENVVMYGVLEGWEAKNTQKQQTRHNQVVMNYWDN